ncbi:ion transporter [Aquimarina brevivitae]|uniref:Voltage-gated potassium channel n=1 Tax=Aquimarina brevivitae TaxID=323412 RepID=A0A4Q7NYR8_9FLAO|nr:ion transporter [Aquimarina brevivitae]RZS92596.1 voltage-gated potassium channel [Aquimarina brevivitae]
MDTSNTKNWKNKLHEVIYEADTPLGKLFDIVLLILIGLSIILVMVESVKGFSDRFYDYLYYGEWVITIFFTLEYIARIISIKRPARYIFSFYGIIDLLSTLPLYLSFFFTGSHALLTVRALRLLRVFRILKISRYISEANKLGKAIKDSGAKILVFLFAVLVVCIIMGTVMYLVEGEESGFKSIPVSVYWCIVTLTTVGFGDIAPVTPLGQFLAALIMIMGYGIIAVPTGIVTAEYAAGGKKPVVPLNTQVCSNCNAQRHRDGAKHCYNCGETLHYD